MSETGQEYVKRKMKNRSPKYASSLRKLQRAQRKAQLIEQGIMDGDDNHVELANIKLAEACDDPNVTYWEHLHPTKGFRARAKQRDALIGLSKAQMWQLITRTLGAYVKGKLKRK